MPANWSTDLITAAMQSFSTVVAPFYGYFGIMSGALLLAFIVRVIVRGRS